MTRTANASAASIMSMMPTLMRESIAAGSPWGREFAKTMANGDKAGAAKLVSEFAAAVVDGFARLGALDKAAALAGGM